MRNLMNKALKHDGSHYILSRVFWKFSPGTCFELVKATPPNSLTNHQFTNCCYQPFVRHGWCTLKTQPGYVLDKFVSQRLSKLHTMTAPTTTTTEWLLEYCVIEFLVWVWSSLLLSLLVYIV